MKKFARIISLICAILMLALTRRAAKRPPQPRMLRPKHPLLKKHQTPLSTPTATKKMIFPMNLTTKAKLFPSSDGKTLSVPSSRSSRKKPA